MRQLVAGAHDRTVFETGDLEAGIWHASTAQGLIDDIPRCADLIHRVVAKAEQIISGRLASALG
ncbi:hypothetical protein [Gordonia asplenii]|uniref:hypothetical protein n=1 Tax=Gordonia asplenii TaxID=2725283 RepID=UPI00406BA9A0